MSYGAEFRRCMEALDVEGVRRLWAQVAPQCDQPRTDADALVTLHMARTSSEAMPLKLRAYSHRWLEERALPSQLPDHLKASAERLYPRIVSGVGIAINLGLPELKPAAEMIRGAMNDAVENCYADGREEPDYVRPRMEDARDRERKRLFGFAKIYSLGGV